MQICKYQIFLQENQRSRSTDSAEIHRLPKLARCRVEILESQGNYFESISVYLSSTQKTYQKIESTKKMTAHVSRKCQTE